MKQHGNYKNGSGIHPYLKTTPRVICERCGVRSNLHTHHRDGDHWNNDPGNLAVLCYRCHPKTHVLGDRLLPLEEEKARDAEILTRYQSGESSMEIARSVDLHQSTVLGIIRRLGAQTRPRSQSAKLCREKVLAADTLREETNQKIAEMYRSGQSAPQIVKALHLSNHERVYAALRRLKVPTRDFSSARSLAWKTGGK